MTDRIAVPGVSSPVTYYVKEIQYPEGDGWIEWKEPKSFVWDAQNYGLYTFTFTNERENPSIVIYKCDSQTGEPLQATFHLSGGNLDYTTFIATGEDGYYRMSAHEHTEIFDKMKVGTTYTLTEVTPPNGYNTLERPITFTLTYGENKVEVPNDPNWYGISITKTDANTGTKTGIEGAVFGIYTDQACIGR